MIRTIEKEKEILKKQIIVLIIINSLFALIIAGIFFITFIQQERYYHSDVFIASFNATKTHDGWIVSNVQAWIKRYNCSGDYYVDDKVELSHLYYVIYNVSNEHIYEKGYISSIKNTSSSLGVVFYDVDNNGILSKGDYMFIPTAVENSENYPHSGDRVVFSYDGCECASGVELP